MKTKFASRIPLSAPALLLGAALACPAALPVAASAQTVATKAPAQETTDQRLKRMEAEMRALQRKVFPDGAGKTFGPEITPASTTPAAADAAPTSTPLTDVMVRLDAVEAQLQRLTGQTEEAQNRMAKLEARIAALEPKPEVLTPDAGATPDTAATPAAVAPAAATPAAKPVATAKPAAATTAAAKPAAKPSADRVAAVQAIEKPVSADKGEDEYLYGYRLYDAKFYPEAEQQLTRTAEQFPKHKRLSYVRNLLGRAYLEDGKPGTAAQWFLQNYLGDKKGDRAPDSLLYLGVAMTKIKDTKRACGAFAELKDTYPTEVIGRLKTQYENATKAVKCD